jgi:hypothetical protein
MGLRNFCDEMMQENGGESQQVKPYHEAIARIYFRNGMVEYLADEILCHCVDGIKANPLCDTYGSNNASLLQSSRCQFTFVLFGRVSESYGYISQSVLPKD